MIILKFVMRPYHMVSLGGYIVEWDFPYRNLIVVNKTSEPIKIEIPVFHEEWIAERHYKELLYKGLLTDDIRSVFEQAKRI